MSGSNSVEQWKERKILSDLKMIILHNLGIRICNYENTFKFLTNF